MRITKFRLGSHLVLASRPHTHEWEYKLLKMLHKYLSPKITLDSLFKLQYRRALPTRPLVLVIFPHENVRKLFNEEILSLYDITVEKLVSFLYENGAAELDNNLHLLRQLGTTHDAHGAPIKHKKTSTNKVWYQDGPEGFWKSKPKEDEV